MCDLDERTRAYQTGLASYTVKAEIIESDHQLSFSLQHLAWVEQNCIIVLHNAMLSVGCGTVFSVLRSQDIQF